MSDLIDIPALEGAKAETEPVPYLVVPKFLRPEALEGISNDFPHVTEPRNHAVGKLEYGPVFAELLEQLAEEEWIRILGAKLGVEDLHELPSNTTVRGLSEASDGNIHTDHWSKVVTVLIYPNTEWTAEGGRLRMLNSATDLDDYATEVVPADGTLLAFRRSPRSFHGHARYVGPRKLIQISWLRRSPLARASQGIARFGTHLSKRLGLHPDS
ncbi:MAG: 2OG-Fe(II) oxygenase [bacterium]|nr:2OG-Fe(II) oxygenase [bacterium]